MNNWITTFLLSVDSLSILDNFCIQCIPCIVVAMDIVAYFSLQWRHNDHAGVSNHQPHGCLLNRLFRHRSKKTSKLRVTGLCVGNSPGPVNSPHKGPVTRKMFPFDDVTMIKKWLSPNRKGTLVSKTLINAYCIFSAYLVKLVVT